MQRQNSTGQATSVVRFDPGARFARHGHSLGEETLVLKGRFSDEYGDYPTGFYCAIHRGSTIAHAATRAVNYL